jgi:hypothetical protein
LHGKVAPQPSPKRPPEPTGSTPPSKSSRIEDEDLRTMLIEEDDPVVLMIEDHWQRSTRAETLKSKFKEFEKLMKFDTFERQSKVETKIDLRWVETIQWEKAAR